MRSGFLGILSCLLALTSSAATPVVRPQTTIECRCAHGEHDAVPTAVEWLPAGAVAAAGDDHAIRVYSAAGELEQTLVGHADWIRDLQLLPNGELASVGDDQRLYLWNITAGEATAQRTVGEGPLSCLALHPNGEQLATVGFHDRLRLVNCANTEETNSFDCPCRDMRSVAFAPDGALLAAAGRNGKLRLYDFTSGSTRDIAADTRRIRAVSFAPSGGLVATAGDGAEVKVWDVTRGEAVAALPARPAKVFAIAFLGDHHLAVGGSDNMIRVWSISSQMETAVLKGHTGTIAALAYDAKTYQLASASFDATVRIWNLAPDQTAALAPLTK